MFMAPVAPSALSGHFSNSKFQKIKTMNKTYSRRVAGNGGTGAKKPGRKPLTTFNSAPVLSSVSGKTKVVVAAADDSLDDFVLAKKTGSNKAKAGRQKKGSPSVFSDDEDGDDNDTFSPTPIFRVEKETYAAAKAKANSKDNAFDKLFAAGPIRSTSVGKSSNPSPVTWAGSSKEESSIEKENSAAGGGLLFASFSERLDLLSQDKAGKKTSTKAKPKSSSGPATLQIPSKKELDKKITHRPFSDDTLNYVVEGLDGIGLSADESVFSPAALPAAPRLLRSSPPTQMHSSPAIGHQATSTPNHVKGFRLSVSKSPMLSPASSIMQQPANVPMIHRRKGGKGWRRSSAVNGLATPRRATLMIDDRRKQRTSGLIFQPPSFQLQQVESSRRKTTACFLSELTEKPFDEELEDSGRGVHHSSFYIEPTTVEKFDESLKEEAICTLAQPLSDIDKVLSRCTTSQILSLENLYSPQRLSQARKVGEGAFGEVFFLPPPEEGARNVVLKIVPVNNGHVTCLVNGQPQMKLMDMLAEIIISTELSKLSSSHHQTNAAPGFLTVRSCYLTEGRYPNKLLEKWDDYRAEKGSDNERPDIFPAKQNFIVLELENGGEDLENVTLNNASQGWAIFQQVAHALAVAEQSLQFEHRDLHWGNVLIDQQCPEKTLTYQSENQDAWTVETHGVRATIIDFSLSRLTLPDDCDIFNNLSEDPDLFASDGDYQFDIYRMMKEHTGNEWKTFHPRTNVMWLHYLLDKLTSEVYYKNKKSKTHRSAMAKMRQMKDALLDKFNSAYEYVTTEAAIE